MVSFAATGRFSLNRLDGETISSALLADGHAVGITLPGCILEAAFSDGAHCLLFITQDVPFEETLDIVLLDGADGVIDRAWLGAAMTTGSFRNVRAEGDAVTFDFFAGHRWRVRLLSRPRWQMPFSEPRGTHRPSFALRHFVVENG